MWLLPTFMNNEQEEAININNYLKTLTKVPLRPHMPMFRLVWSDDQRELRRGEFNEFYGPIFLRQYTGVKWTEKYPFIKKRWVFEQWYPPVLVISDELPDSRHGSYEPIYVFEDKNFQPIPLNIQVVQLIIRHINRPGRGEMARKTAIANDIEDKENAMYKRDLDVLNDESYLVSQFHTGSAGLVPSKYDVKSPNLRNKNG